jgi:acetyl esterase/lipase
MTKYLLSVHFILALAFNAVLGTTSLLAAGPDPVLLWPDGAPDAKGDAEHDTPTIRIYQPPQDEATGCGVVICPGGGYGILAYDHEGHQIAKWFNSIGVTGFVLRYRHSPHYKHPTPLGDAQRAIRYVRANAKKLGVSPQRIGIMGFSAGGHLASTAATHFDAGKADAADPIDRQSSRPDFAILGYAVISMTADFGHKGSRRNLIGEDGSDELANLLSNEKQVTSETPPTFLFHTGEDAGVPVENALAFYQALRKAKVPGELHVYQYGPHGLGLAAGAPVVNTWKDRLGDWLTTSGFRADVTRAAVEGTVRNEGQDLRWGMITFVPEGGPNQPIAFAMISRGKFRIPEHRGAVVGACRIEVRDLGTVEPRPTIEDVRRLDDGNYRVDVKADSNKLVVELKTE